MKINSTTIAKRYFYLRAAIACHSKQADKLSKAMAMYDWMSETIKFDEADIFIDEFGRICDDMDAEIAVFIFLFAFEMVED